MRYTIGLDIGIDHVGWSVINLDRQRIEAMNVRMFDPAENPRDGSSLARPRREARSSRRKNRRRRYRVSRVRHFFIDRKLLSQDQANGLYEWLEEDLDIWRVRVKGIESKLTDREFARILIHFAKNRGFKSNRKSDEQDGETGVLLDAIRENAKLMNKHGYRTVAEMFCFDEKFSKHKRNKSGDYSRAIARGMIKAEIKLMFKRQRKFGHPFATEENEKDYIRIWASQRPFATEDDILSKIGNCTFEESEKRAPKFSYSFERFRAYDKLNRLNITSTKMPQQRPLTQQEREAAMNLLLNIKEVTYADLRKALHLKEHERFNEVLYDYSKTNVQNEKRRFLALEGTYQIKQTIKKVKGKALAETYRPIDYDTIAYAITIYKDDENLKNYLLNKYVSVDGNRVYNLANRTYDEELIEELLYLDFSQFGHLSFTALKRILPHVEAGLYYNEACKNAGYSLHHGRNKRKKKLLPVIPIKDIRNPVVIRAFSQTRKVINAIIKRYGSPSALYIELTRNIGRSYRDRREDERIFTRNRKENEKTRELISKLHPELSNPRGHDILKYRLWQEQNERCAYSLKMIPVERLFMPGYAEVNYVIPYIRSFDDSNNNKVLVLESEKQAKQNLTPYEWFGHNPEKWSEFETFVKSLKVNKKKKRLLLTKVFDEERAEIHKARQLTDSRYITRFLVEFIEDNLQFKEIRKRKKYVASVNGAYTSLLRKRWGFNYIGDKNDLRHAVDAVIVGVSHPVRHHVNTYFKRRSIVNKDRFPEPWQGFTRELGARLLQDHKILTSTLKQLKLSGYDDECIEKMEPIFVSRMPKRSVKGQIHAETVRRHRGYNERGLARVVTKTRLINIPFDKKTGDFPMYGKESDPGSYNAIKHRYLQHGGNVQKAFREPLYKPAKNPENAPIIRGVKIEKFINRGISLTDKAVVEKGGIVRTEVFRHLETGRFYLAPVYVNDIVTGIEAKKLITPRKPYEEWRDITDEFEFQFNLYANDIIKIRLPREKNTKMSNGETISWREGMFYFIGPHTATAQLNIINHKNSFKDAVGSQSLELFEKYQVDLLGNLYRVNKEKRYVLQALYEKS